MSDVFQSLSPEQIAQLLGQAGAQYGDQGALYADETAFAPAQKRLNFVQDLIQSLGFDPIQMAGGGQYQAPVQQPFVNYTEQMYGSNPVFQMAFEAMANGDDPMTVVAALKKAEAAGTLPGADTLPRNVQGGFDQGVDWGAVQGVITDYGKSALQGQQEMAQQGAEAAASGAQYRSASGKPISIAGNPYSSASEYDVMGAPSVDEFVNAIAQQRLRAGTDLNQGQIYSRQNTEASVGGLPPGLAPQFIPGTMSMTSGGPGDAAAFHRYEQANQAKMAAAPPPVLTPINDERRAMAAASRGADMFHKPQAMLQAAAQQQAFEQALAQLPQEERQRERFAAGTRANPEYEKRYRELASQRLERSKSNRVNSEAARQSESVMRALAAVLFGQ